MANPMYGQNKFDSQLSQGYLDFVSGYQGNLTATGISVSQAEGEGAVKGGDETLSEVDAATLVANAVNTHAGDASAATSCYLPPAVKGTHLVLEITGDMDEANAQTIHCNNSVGTVKPVGNVFAKQIIGSLNGATALPIETAGDNITPTSENLIYTPAAANTNALGIGSVIHFYAPVDGQWLVKINFIPEGTGATGAFTVS